MAHTHQITGHICEVFGHSYWRVFMRIQHIIRSVHTFEALNLSVNVIEGLAYLAGLEVGSTATSNGVSNPNTPYMSWYVADHTL